MAALALAPSDPATVYASGPGLQRSRDGGRNWTRLDFERSAAAAVPFARLALG